MLTFLNVHVKDSQGFVANQLTKNVCNKDTASILLRLIFLVQNDVTETLSLSNSIQLFYKLLFVLHAIKSL